MKKIKKKKAFIGALISGISSIAGVIGDSIRAKKEAQLAQERYEKEQGEIYAKEAQATAQALTQEAQNQQYVEQMKSRISFKMGGTKKIKKKKAGLGAEWKNMSSLDKAGDILGGVGGAVSGISSLIGGLTYQPKDYTLKYNDTIQAQAPKIIKDPNQAAQQTILAMQQASAQTYNKNINPILSQARLGAKRVVKKNLNRFK